MLDRVFVFAFIISTSLCAMNFRTFYAGPFSLKPGDVVNTSPDQTPIEFVGDQPYALRYATGEVVDSMYRPVPLTEVYVHHWLFFVNITTGVFPDGQCSKNRVANGGIMGVGAETRRTLVNIPAPYGIVYDGYEKWFANFHLMRTDGVTDVQRCIECHCSDGTPTNPHGDMGCCGDYCSGVNQTSEYTKQYFFKYVIGYSNITNETVAVQPVILDATATNTIDCKVQHQIPASSQPTVLTSTITIPKTLEIVFALGHQHIGGVSITLSHINPVTGSNSVICRSNPVYGNSDKLGYENGYLVQMTSCAFDKPVVVPGGHQLQVTSIYNNRTLVGGHPEHEGVMSLFFVAAKVTDCPKISSSWKTSNSTAISAIGFGFSPMLINTNTHSSLTSALDACEGNGDCRAVMVSNSSPNVYHFMRGADTTSSGEPIGSYCAGCSLVGSGSQCYSGNGATHFGCSSCLSGQTSNPDSCLSCPEGYELNVTATYLSFICSGACVPLGEATETCSNSLNIDSLCPLYSCGQKWTSYIKENTTCNATKSGMVDKTGLVAGIVVILLVFFACLIIGAIKLLTRNRVVISATRVLHKN
eukprot:c18215_g1_i1.p1 GENE.c18215_g1_i1~~c18215_g1_i1.p1  ORF type:complete len:586 (+),score=235.20 c18215_g1_i1:40-1797(+)